jgi:Putative lumazine-binding
MKKMLLVTGLSLLFLHAAAQTQNAPGDWQLVQNALNLYIDGQATGDSAKVAQSFHDSWQLKGFRDSSFFEVSKAQYVVGYKKHEKYPTWNGRIVFIDITNNIACAKVEISTSKLLFTDYFNLIKTNEGWFIVDKISTRSSHKTIAETEVKPKN